MNLQTKHTIVLTLVELSIFLRLPYKPSEGFFFSTNIIVPLTALSLLLLMLAYTRAQMKLKVEILYEMWENVNIVRKYFLVVFCIGTDLCNMGLGIFFFLSFTSSKIMGQTCIFTDHVKYGILSMFIIITLVRVLLQGRICMLVWSILEYVFFREMLEISYITKQIYLPWVLIAIN